MVLAISAKEVKAKAALEELGKGVESESWRGRYEVDRLIKEGVSASGAYMMPNKRLDSSAPLDTYWLVPVDDFPVGQFNTVECMTGTRVPMGWRVADRLLDTVCHDSLDGNVRAALAGAGWKEEVAIEMSNFRRKTKGFATAETRLADLAERMAKGAVEREGEEVSSALRRRKSWTRGDYMLKTTRVPVVGLKQRQSWSSLRYYSLRHRSDVQSELTIDGS
jgi:hypothetical protein